MSYLRKADYLSIIQSDNLDTILRVSETDLGEEANVLNFMEEVAVSEASSYLAHRYDTALIFQDIPALWLIGNSYDIDDRVEYPAASGIFYKSLTDGQSGNQPDTSPTVWALDSREPKLLIVVLDVALFHIHKRINPRNIPELRITAYEDAIEWLGMIANDKLAPVLPKLALDEDDREPGAAIQYGSQPKQKLGY